MTVKGHVSRVFVRSRDFARAVGMFVTGQVAIVLATGGPMLCYVLLLSHDGGVGFVYDDYLEAV